MITPPFDTFTPGTSLVEHTKDLYAEITVLENALCKAQNLVKFLHDCLMDPLPAADDYLSAMLAHVDAGLASGDPQRTDYLAYVYAYPQRTLDTLAEWEALVGLSDMCHHSSYVTGCNACHHRAVRRNKLYHARLRLSALKEKGTAHDPAL